MYQYSFFQELFLELEVYCKNVTKMGTGRFAPKPVPPGTIRSKTIFRTGRFTPGRFAPFVKNEIKVFLRNENRC